MKAYLYLCSTVLLLLSLGCASKKTMESGDARQTLKEKYDSRIGTATKEDLIQELGTPSWCQPKTVGGETCRFYKKIGTVWAGTATDRVHRETFDEIVADFDSSGILKNFTAKAQR